MINILHVVDKLSVGDSTIHGVTRLFSWWMPRFNKEKFKVGICCLRKRDKAGAFLEELGIKVYYLNKSKFNFLTLTDLLGLVEKIDADILHLHGYGATTFGRVCGKIKKIPCIVHEHMYDVKIPSYQRLADLLLSRTHYQAIAVSKSVKEFLVSYRKIAEERIDVIYNGAPLDAYRKNVENKLFHEKKRDWKAKLNIPESYKTVGIVGRLHAIKGHCYFLEAVKLIKKEYKKAKFIVIGDGELLEQLKNKCQKLGISEDVIFTGYCDDVPSMLINIDIKVISSLSEGVPLTLFEAMAANCAIVSTNVGGISEVIMNNDTGLLVPPKDPEALAEKILSLLKDTKYCSTMAAKAKEMSVHYDVRSGVHRFEACYEKIFDNISGRREI